MRLLLIDTVLQAERAVQLRNLAKLSALVAGFAMASFLQFNFDTSIVQPSVLTGYALVTALVVRLVWFGLVSLFAWQSTRDVQSAQ